MPAVGSFICFLLLLGGCRDEAPADATATAASAPAATSGAPAPSAPGAPGAPTPPGPDRPVEEVPTVDDTVPSSEGEGEGDDPDADCAPPGSDLKPMEVLRFTFASGLEGKDPKDRLASARAGQRVYAHLTMRNRSGRKRCLHLTFRVGGKKRTEVTLKIGESWSWRTWAYNTVKADDTGPLELTIEDDQGQVVLQKELPVVK